MQNAHFTSRLMINMHHADSQDVEKDIITTVLKNVFREDENTENMDNYELSMEAIRKLDSAQEIEHALRNWMQYAEITEFPDPASVQRISSKAKRAALKICYILCPERFQKAA